MNPKEFQQVVIDALRIGHQKDDAEPAIVDDTGSLEMASVMQHPFPRWIGVERYAQSGFDRGQAVAWSNDDPMGKVADVIVAIGVLEELRPSGCDGAVYVGIEARRYGCGDGSIVYKF